MRFESQERRFKERVHIERFSDICAQPNNRGSTYDSILPTANALEYVLTMTEISPFLHHYMIGTSYGQKRPPLTHILQSILDRYPDGGQILKVFTDHNNQTVDSSSYRDNDKNLCIFLPCLND